jgi:hypothetical protein
VSDLRKPRGRDSHTTMRGSLRKYHPLNLVPCLRKHTCGRRLRAAGVSLETRKVLLGHTNGDITSHYSALELRELIDAMQRICRDESGKTPALTLLKRQTAR